MQICVCATFVICATLTVQGAENHGLTVSTGTPTNATVTLWLESSLNRIFLNTPAGSTNLDLLAPRNGRISFQVGIKNDYSDAIFMHCGVQGADGLKPRVRFVGMEPLPHFTRLTDKSELDGFREYGGPPGLVPDILWPQSNATIGSYESRSYWISLQIPADASPGVREFTLQFAITNRSSLKTRRAASLPVKLEISPFVVQPRKNFPVTHWWRGEATWDYYKTGMFDDRWYQLTRDQLKDMLEHGSDVIYVPIFINRPETFKRPCQMLIVNETSPGKYSFDWSEVKKFTDMCKEIGFKEFEWSHLWVYGGVKHAMPMYTKKGAEMVRLWPADTGAFSDTYLGFLKQFLPEFHDFLVRENLLETSYFHLSDEPGGEAIENYKRARQFLRDHAPWMKVMDALSDIRYGKQGLTDMPIPQVGAAQAYIDAGIPHWVYFCCSPKGNWLNRFLDTPLPKVRMSGWLFYRLGAKGFLHWGFNYWHKMSREEIGDPFEDASNADWPAIPYGDPFMIYPGADGKPIDSLRWEVFAESLQDYAILQTAGISPNDPMLSDLKSYADFPKNEEWIESALKKILKPSVNQEQTALKSN